jgi:hypothetical protein
MMTGERVQPMYDYAVKHCDAPALDGHELDMVSTMLVWVKRVIRDC